MAKEFTLEGEVGWEIDAWVVKSILRQAGGEDVTIRFSSPGGSVFEGITIFNLFKAYAGRVKFHIIGLAASMGSYIPLAADEITAEPNSVFMIHNARSFVSGDQNAMRKRADIIEGLSKIMAKEYAKKTGKTETEVQAMMDVETWLFGAQMVGAGFVDSINGEPDSDPDAQAIHTALAKEAFEAVTAKLRDEKPDDYEQAAALLPIETETKKPEVVVVGAEKQEKITMAEKLTLAELKAQEPALCAELIAEGIATERDRVSAHLTAGEMSGDMKTALASAKDGSLMTQTLQTQYMMAATNRRDIDNRTEDEETTATAADGATVTATAETDAEKVVAGVAAKFGVKVE